MEEVVNFMDVQIIQTVNLLCLIREYYLPKLITTACQLQLCPIVGVNYEPKVKSTNVRVRSS